MGVYLVCMLILHNKGIMISFYDLPSRMEVINLFFHVETKFALLYALCMDFSITKYSIFWDMRVINWHQENLCNCCNSEWKKIFDVLVMCAIHIGIHRWNSIIMISVAVDRRNLRTVTSISLHFPTLPSVAYPEIFFGGGSTNSEGRENRDLGAVAP
jgi:hypothetical protein